jgi:hypothetical protein
MIIIEHDKNFIRCVNVSHLLIQYFLLGHTMNKVLTQNCHNCVVQKLTKEYYE